MTTPRLGWWWAATPAFAGGVVLFATDQVRLAGYAMASGLLLGALLRLVLPASRSGGLAVRSRMVDVVSMTALGVALAVITALLDLSPRG